MIRPAELMIPTFLCSARRMLGVLLFLSIASMPAAAQGPNPCAVLERVSVASDGTEGNHASMSSAVSADGRFVVFQSKASNLVPGDVNNRRDTFIHDRVTGTTQLVSVASGGTQANAGHGGYLAVSADGRFAAFMSDATNLVPGETNGR